MVEVKAMMVGVVIELCTEAGAEVAQDEPVMFLESMKMELPVPAPRAGVVTELRVKEGDLVQEGDVVAVLE